MPCIFCKDKCLVADVCDAYKPDKTQPHRDGIDEPSCSPVGHNTPEVPQRGRNSKQNAKKDKATKEQWKREFCVDLLAHLAERQIGTGLRKILDELIELHQWPSDVTQKYKRRERHFPIANKRARSRQEKRDHVMNKVGPRVQKVVRVNGIDSIVGTQYSQHCHARG